MDKESAQENTQHHEVVNNKHRHSTEKTAQASASAMDWDSAIEAARRASEREHALTIREALRAYWPAVLWSLTVSMAIVMEGYATILVGNLFAYPTYAERFGVYDETTKSWQIQSKWQSAMGSGGQGFAFLGAFLNGWIISKYGYKPAFATALLLMTSFIFVNFFGMSVELQAVGQILSGIPWGMMATTGSAYASEVCPLRLRPFLTAYVNMCWAIGQFVAAGVLKSYLERSDQWAWRIPFGLQWMWVPGLVVGAIFMPESPWHLIQKGRHADAEKVLYRLTAKSQHAHVQDIVAHIHHTDRLERGISAGTSYLDCFKGSDLRRTEIACVTFVGQVLAGSQFAYSATYFFQQAGLDSSNAYALNLGGTGIALTCTIIVWFLLNRVGRRRLYVVGMSLEALWLFLIGILALPKNNNVKWAQASLCLIWLATFHLSLGPVGWVIPAEVSSSRLRSKTVVLARNTYYLAILVANTIQPYMMNPTAWNWKGKSGFFWFAFATLTAIWAWFRLPETKHRTFQELDLMFEAKLATRQFRNHVIDVYEGHDEKVVEERV